MRIRFRRLSETRHVLTIVRDGDAPQSIELETRSTLLHDLLHYAVEAEARHDGGFWGALARGETLADLNAREASVGVAAAASALAEVELIVGALHGLTHGHAAHEVFSGLTRYAASREVPLPEWVTSQFVAGVAERLRRLRGKWNATPFGETMELPWPADRDSPTTPAA